MTAYIIRRFLYAMPILVGVNLITFFLFFVVNSPDDMARVNLGVKRVTPEAIEQGLYHLTGDPEGQDQPCGGEAGQGCINLRQRTSDLNRTEEVGLDGRHSDVHIVDARITQVPGARRLDRQHLQRPRRRHRRP